MKEQLMRYIAVVIFLAFGTVGCKNNETAKKETPSEQKITKTEIPNGIAVAREQLRQEISEKERAERVRAEARRMGLTITSATDEKTFIDFLEKLLANIDSVDTSRFRVFVSASSGFYVIEDVVYLDIKAPVEKSVSFLKEAKPKVATELKYKKIAEELEREARGIGWNIRKAIWLKNETYANFLTQLLERITVATNLGPILGGYKYEAIDTKEIVIVADYDFSIIGGMIRIDARAPIKDSVSFIKNGSR